MAVDVTGDLRTIGHKGADREGCGGKSDDCDGGEGEEAVECGHCAEGDERARI